MKKFALSFSVVMTFALIFVVSSVFAAQTNTTLRNWDGQAMHSSYQNNTNSCGSCHKLHAGSLEKYLLWDGASGKAFCESCHDGTMSAPNVDGHSLNAGTFDATADGQMSMHEVGGTAQTLAAAPGGDADGTGIWAGKLSCESCHMPHSTSTLALLKTDINTDLDLKKTALTATSIKAYDAKPTTQVAGEKFVYVKKTLSGTGDLAAGKSYYKYSQAPYSLVDGAVVYEPYIWVAAKSSKLSNNAPGTSDVAAAMGYTRVNAVVKKADLTYGTPQSGSISPDGLVYGGAAVVNATDMFTTQVTAELTIGAYKVQAGDTAYGTVGTAAGETPVGTVVNGSIWNVNEPTYTLGAGASFSLYCGQCHTDYISNSYSNSSGLTYTAAPAPVYPDSNNGVTSMHRHNTMRESLSCTRCHFSHGTDSEIMRNGDQTTPVAALSDAAGVDSAIKRFVGFSVCLQCHTPGNVKLTDKPANAAF